MPERKVLVSSFTVAGYNMAQQIIPEADGYIYFPLDLPWVTESVVRRVRPGIFLPVETELWPNFLKAIRKRHIPVMLVNGRISERSVKTYHYLFSIWRDMLRTVNRFCMQSSIDANYITRLGADPQKIFVTGNTKFDQTYAEVTPEDLATYKTELGLGEDSFPVILAGSTHAPEEDIVLNAFTVLRKQYPKARLVIAPRMTDRVDEIRKLCKKFGYETGLRSKLKISSGIRSEYPVVIIDTIGELGRIYAVGDIVFVDDDTRYMYDLPHEIRFVNAGEYGVDSPEMFLGFLCGMLTQNFDISTVFVDAFMKLVRVPADQLEVFFTRLNAVSEAHHVTFIISASVDDAVAPDFMKQYFMD